MSRPPLEELARAYWAGETGGGTSALLTTVTAPVAALFGVGVRLRNRAFDTGLLGTGSVGVPVLSVGNLSVGGTGKTPVVRWVVDRLLARGLRPAVVSRGYGADELDLHRRWHPDTPVVADRDRVAAAARAVVEGADVVVVDDGFQHRALARDADIVLVSAHDPFPPRLLPRGPWREPLGSLERASLVLVTGKGVEGQKQAGQLETILSEVPRHPPLGCVGIRAAGWQNLAGGVVDAPSSRENVLAVASVAHPSGFLDLLREAGFGERVELVAHSDHHPYSADDVRNLLIRAGDRRIVTTEKDAVKLGKFEEMLTSTPEPRVLALEIRPGPGVDRLLDRLLDRALAHGEAKS
ncbi:tetraacyldisaccharide 4'-kinase [soil metagenome]